MFDDLKKKIDQRTEEQKTKIESFKQEHELKTREIAYNSALKIDLSNIKVIQIPSLLGISEAWQRVNDVVGEGYTIKAVIEREATHTSLVILEKIK